MRPLLFIAFMFILVSGIYAQKKEIKKAISNNTWQGAYRIAYSDKGLFENDIQSYCRENGFVFISSTKKEFFVYGKKEKLVTSFLFLTSEEHYNHKELEAYNAARSSQEYLSYLNNFPNGKHISEIRELETKREYNAYVSSINTRNYKSYLDNFPNGIHYNEVLTKSKTFDSQLYNANSLTDLLKLVQDFPNKKNEIEDKAFDLLKNKDELNAYLKKIPSSKFLHQQNGDSIFSKSWSSHGPENCGYLWNKMGIYQGGFKNGRYNGEGTYFGLEFRPDEWGDESMREANPNYKVEITGTWVNGQISNGTMSSELVAVNSSHERRIFYTGSFRNNRFTGNGEYTIVDLYFLFGRYRYGCQGNFYDGKPNGKFVVYGDKGSYRTTCSGCYTFSDIYTCLLNDERERDRRFTAEYEKQQCDNCVINYDKSKFPVDRKDWLNFDVQDHGEIFMTNGESYWFYYSNNKWRFDSGLLGLESTYFENFDEMLEEFLKRCRKRYCK